ncbi:MAG: BON domain-containing protein [Gemmatimonadota bacterium]|nr:BON domain-containing protein [Gemmatimonadota bacterium]
MARDFENFLNPETLSEEELRALVRQELGAHEQIAADNILVTTVDGVVTLSGRVGTEGEQRIAEHILTDVIGLTAYHNDLVVDAIRRDEEPEDVEEHSGMIADTGGAPLGHRPDHVDDEAEHLEEDLDAMLYGTHDLQSAIERGTPWVPPDSPTQEGLTGTDGDSGRAGSVGGEDH